MLGAGTESGLLGFCARIAQRVFQPSTRCRKPSGFSFRRDRHIRRRLLTIESLEGRALMSADGLAANIDPNWFASYTTNGTLLHAGTAAISTESGNAQTSAASTSAQTPNNTYDWIVQFNTQSLGGIASVGQVSSLLVGSGVEFQVLEGLGLVGQVLVRSSGVSLDAVSSWLTNNVNIAGFEQDSLRQLEAVPNDPGMGQLYGMNKINAAGAWNLTTGSRSVVVGVIDTGVDYNHPDLAANMWRNPGEIAGNGRDDDGNGFVDDVYGYDFVHNNGNPMDDNSHGTHVSGTIAGVGNNSQGVAGINWTTSVMALKFLDGNGSGYISDAVRAVNYATMMKSRYNVNVKVLNNSWGGGGYSSALDTAIQASNSAGILFVAAAGNSATNNDAIAQYPANYTSANVISVAATDQNDLLASFSCYGATTVDLAAPGVGIYSTVPNNRYAVYSGTSMATPQVTGAAALAWAYNPNATVAQVRNALLQGVDRISSLNGKVASGGRLNVYNTLQLLGGGVAPSAPVLGSFYASQSTVTQGANLTLTAQGASSSTGVKAVYFYRDTNGNGVFDSTDSSIGSVASVVNGTATLSISTSALTPGAYRYFARTLDNNNQWSSPLSALVTIAAANAQGSNAAAATLINVNSTLSASIGTGGETDWFKFQAVAGKKYAIATKLAGLRDSTLTLYDRNGVTQLAYNDDVSTSNLASFIQWTAPVSGTYFVKVAGYNTSLTGSYQLSLTRVNTAPVLPAIANQTISANGGLTLALAASDAEGDTLTYSVSATTVDPLAKKAYDLDQQLGLKQMSGGYWTNLRRASEKYLSSASGTTYYILPNGALYRWGGSMAASTLVQTFNASYYANPRLLHEAQAPGQAPLSNAIASLQISGNRLIITPARGYTGEFTVNVAVNDGVNSASQSFKVTVANAATQRLGLRSFSTLDGSGDYSTPPASTVAAVSDILYALGTNWYANSRTSSTFSSDIAAPGLQANYPLRSAAALRVEAVNSIYHDTRAPAACWQSNVIGKKRTEDMIGNTSDKLSAGGADLYTPPGSDKSADLEDTLKSWENQGFEKDVRHNLFALLGQD